MTENEAGKDPDKERKLETDEAGSQPQKQQNGNSDGSLDDREMAILLLGMEETLIRHFLEAGNQTFSTGLESMLAGFHQNSDKNRRNLRDLFTRQGWFSPEPAKKEDFDKAIRKIGGASPPAG